MRILGKTAAMVALVLASAWAEGAFADDAAAAPAAAPAKPTAPALADVLGASGLTMTGYIDATGSAGHTSSADYNTFALNQAAFTLASQPTSGLGALVNVAAGTEANGNYAPGYGYGATSSGTKFDLLQAYVQYISGKTTVLAGKFVTLAGAEVAAPTGNTNVTRSLLFWYSEPVTHTGARVVYTASDTANFTFGLNNGWNAETSTGNGKTVEVGMGLTPSKTFALAAAAYYGDTDPSAHLGKKTLVDVVATWTASAAVTVILNADWDQQDISGSSSASWYGAAAYVNWAINSTWRTSIRAEYLDDRDGFATGTTAENKVKEGTVTFGYAPSKNYEFRLEGRYDKSDAFSSGDLTQAWLSAIYKF
jgi:hypothetical protein